MPTIVTSVPNNAFVEISGAVAQHVGIPVVASNRINMPEAAEQILTETDVALISMARPLLSDPDWVRKAQADDADAINTCIACNQACLDHAFVHKTVSCLLNPRAGHETSSCWARAPGQVGGCGRGGARRAGDGGDAAQRGHRVTLFEANSFIGGQFDMARRIPGKEEFNETIRYFTTMLARYDIAVRLDTRASAAELADFDDVVLATGVAPRMPSVPGIDHRMVLSYAEAIYGVKPLGRRVAVIGAGGIGFDVSELLVTDQSPTLNLKEWKAEWGVLNPAEAAKEARGGLTEPIPAAPAREVYLLQRSPGPQGSRLGKTSGWVHRASLKFKGVQQLSGVNYERIDDDGLHISFGRNRDRPRVLAVDNVVVCAGQQPVRDLVDELRTRYRAAHHRRRRNGRGTRRRTGDPSGHRTRRPAIEHPLPLPRAPPAPLPRARVFVQRHAAFGGQNARSRRGERPQQLGLAECLDRQADGDLVADDRAATLQRHIDVDAEVLAVQHDRCLEARDLTVAHAGVHAVVLEVQADRLGDALQGELTVDQNPSPSAALRSTGRTRSGGSPRQRSRRT